MLMTYVLHMYMSVRYVTPILDLMFMTFHYILLCNIIFLKLSINLNFFLFQQGVTGKLDLKGTFGGKTVSYSTTIETPSSSHPDLPLHRMAAKYQIKDLEVNDEGTWSF